MLKSNEIHFIEQRPEVEVHLPDGRILSGPRGACAADFLKPLEAEFAAPVVAVIVNTSLRELTFPIKKFA